MQQTGFWATVSLLIASLILLLAWGLLPLFTTDQPAVIERLYHPDGDTQTMPSTMALYGSTVSAQLNWLDVGQRANHALFQAVWSLLALAGVGGIISGGLALWWPTWMTQTAFAGVVCGVVSLVCLGFLRFQYANMTSTSLFNSTAVGWWTLVIAGGGLVAQGLAGRPRPRVVIAVPQPPPFSQRSPQEIFASIPTDLSASMLVAPRLRLVHLGTSRAYSLDFSRSISIGRGRQNDIVLPDEKVSRHHAVMRWQGGWVMISNQSHHAPLYLNQQPIEGEYPLLLGDTITLGQTHLRLTSE